MNLLDLIPKGAENRITSRELENLTLLPGSTIRAKVNALRAQGEPIGSDHKGYFIAVKQEEIIPTIRILGSRIRAMERAREGLLQAQFNMIFGGNENENNNTNSTEDKEKPPKAGEIKKNGEDDSDPQQTLRAL